MWAIWCTFCRTLNADPFLLDISDPVPLLQVFALRYRSGQLSASGHATRKRQVEEALRAVGQTLAGLGLPDPRLTRFSDKLDFRLRRQLATYQRMDPAPARVKPIPLPVLQFAAAAAAQRLAVLGPVLADLLIIAFFFLLRPGEYVHSTADEAAPFRLQDVHLFRGPTKLNLHTTADADISQATYCGLEFSTQKNGVKGEIIGLGRSGSSLWCPVLAVVRRVLALRAWNAPPPTPLHAYVDRGKWFGVTASHVTAQLRSAVLAMGAQFGLAPADVSARATRTSGAMALLCAQVDSDRIRLIGRWRSDEMFRYLHTQASPVTAQLAPRMLQRGSFVVVPNSPTADLVSALE
mmetsp:Transcript_9230/g.13387  ORF Transcript_9230/g.13387 Transcript_9230/m.13387 type:complete len:350 (-) Transcript_9230:545-1594(-)